MMIGMLTIRQFILSMRCYFSSFNNCHFGKIMRSCVMRSLFLSTCDGLNSHVCSLSVLLFLWRYYLLSCGFPYGLRVIFYLYRQWQLISCCRKLVSLGRIGLVKSWLFHIDSNTFLYQSLYSLVWTSISMSFHRSSYMDFIRSFSFLQLLNPLQ